MTPARIMAEVYGRILRKMRGEGFRVFEKRYRVGHAAQVRNRQPVELYFDAVAGVMAIFACSDKSTVSILNYGDQKEI